MKRKFVIILSCQTVVILLMLLFSLYQKSRANVATEMAVQMQKVAEEMHDAEIRLRDECEKAKEDCLKKSNP